MSRSASIDALVVGAGHNGLVAASVLARAGLGVHVVEARDAIGGAARTEYPFAAAPELGASTGAYLLGLAPPELLRDLGVSLPLVRRDPHYFLPTVDRGYLLFGSDTGALESQITTQFGAHDWRAYVALGAELDCLRSDLAPCWMREPMSLEGTADRFVRPELRQAFIDLVEQPVERYLERFDFRSELLWSMFAVTDAFAGLSAGPECPGTGHNFLVHNMCRLPGADGTWMIVRGGMGTVTRTLAERARQLGATIETGAPVAALESEGGRCKAVVLEDGRRLEPEVVVANCDPFTLLGLCDTAALPDDFVDSTEAMRREGTTLKVNLALAELPRFRCLPESRGQHHTTTHLLPTETASPWQEITAAWNAASRGELADFPPIEWYTHTAADPSLRDPQGRHNAAFFVQWVPNEPRDGGWERHETTYVERLIAIAERFAPGFAASVVDVFALPPPRIEEHFGMSGGHIHHVDNSFAFDRRFPYATPIAGLYSCSAGCHPAGSVIGCAGYNAAQRILRDLEISDRVSS